MLTRGDHKQKSCFDYMLRSLVYENKDNMERLVNAEVHDIPKPRSLLRQLNVVMELLYLIQMDPMR